MKNNPKTVQHPNPSDDVQLEIETVIPTVEQETEKTPGQPNHSEIPLVKTDTPEESKDKTPISSENKEEAPSSQNDDDSDARDQIETISP
jgi:hypothetical protein